MPAAINTDCQRPFPDVVLAGATRRRATCRALVHSIQTALSAIARASPGQRPWPWCPFSERLHLLPSPVWQAGSVAVAMYVPFKRTCVTPLSTVSLCPCALPVAFAFASAVCPPLPVAALSALAFALDCGCGLRPASCRCHRFGPAAGGPPADRFTLGLGSTLGSGFGASYIFGGAWSLPSSAPGFATIGDPGSLTLAGTNSLGGLSAERTRRVGFQLLPLLAESLDLLPMLSELLSLCLVHRLESQRTVLCSSSVRRAARRPRGSSLLTLPHSRPSALWAAQVRGGRASS